MSTLDVKTLRQDFPMLASGGLAYLDSAASSLTPTSVIEAMDAYYKEYRANVHRGMYKAAARASAEFEAARDAVARFVNADREEVVFTRGATEALNLAAQMLTRDLKPGDEIVATEMEHHANLLPWQQLAKRHGLILKLIPVTDGFALDLDAARALIGPKTKIVAVTHVSNVLGTVNPVKELAALARAASAKIVVDAAQSAPHMKVDFRDLGCDLLAFSGHKMLGPTGIGVLCGKHALLEALEPTQFGGDMVREATYAEASWNDLPWKFEPGTPNVSGAIGLAAAIAYLEKIGMDEIEAHGRALGDLAAEKLSAIPGARVFRPASGAGGLVSFDVQGIHPHDLSTIFDDLDVAIRGGHHCAMPLVTKLGVPALARASFHLYNDERDVERLVAAVREAQRVMKTV